MSQCLQPSQIHYDKGKWVLALRNCSSAGSSGNVSGNQRLANQRPQVERWFAAQRLLQQIDDVTTPSKSSCSFSPVTTRRVCWFFPAERGFASGALRSICLISARRHDVTSTVRWLRFSTAQSSCAPGWIKKSGCRHGLPARRLPHPVRHPLPLISRITAFRCALAQRMVSGKKTAAVKNSQLVERPRSSPRSR